MKSLLVEQSIDVSSSNVPQDGGVIYKYKVIKVTNSTTPAIRDSLSRDDIDSYCAMEDWKVTIR